MKFEKEQPCCRSQHACCQHEGLFMLYGGRDIMTTESFTSELWLMRPLREEGRPAWYKFDVTDAKFVLPDHISRHKIIIRQYGLQT